MIRGRRGRHTGWLGVAALLVGLAVADVASAKPEWVERHGLSSAHPGERFVTGYGTAKGDDALARAKTEAAADLARKLSVRIESQVSDVSAEADGEYRYKLAAVTRTTTDLKVSNLQYEEPYKRWGRVYVLAWVDRGRAARVQIKDRDRALAALRRCLAAGAEEMQAGRKRSALATYETCRRPVAQALQHDAVAHALAPSLAVDAAVQTELAEASRRLDREIESVFASPAKSLAGAAETLALQLGRQGVSRRSRLIVSHLSYGTTNLSSSFGQQAGIEIERALARQTAGGDTPVGVSITAASPALAVTGVYLESGERVRLSVTAREIETGRLVASAETTLPNEAIPSGLELKPANFDTALRDQKILREGAEASGELRVQVSTDRGRGGVVYGENERIRLFVRVNRPAWVRLVYVLQNGAQVPIDQAFRVDAGQVDTQVVYPVDFEVVPPFGIEMVHATAFTEKPKPLATRERVIEGQRYEVVADGMKAVVRTRGIAARKRAPIAEDTLTVTTMPSF